MAKSEPVKVEPESTNQPQTPIVKEDTPASLLKEIGEILAEFKSESDIPAGHKYFDLVAKHRLLSNP